MWHSLRRDKRKVKVAHYFHNHYQSAGAFTLCGMWYVWNYTSIGYCTGLPLPLGIRHCKHCLRIHRAEIENERAGEQKLAGRI